MTTALAQIPKQGQRKAEPLEQGMVLAAKIANDYGSDTYNGDTVTHEIMSAAGALSIDPQSIDEADRDFLLSYQQYRNRWYPDKG